MSTRDRILDAAAQVMRTQGYARATTKEIARVAECSEPLLYKYFRDKEDLLLHVFSERVQAFAPVSKAGSGTVADNLVAAANDALRFYGTTFPMMGSLLAAPSLLAATRESLAKYGAGPANVVSWLANYLRDEQRLGRIAADSDPDAIAALLFGACFQQAFLHYFEHGPDGGEIPSRVAQSLVDAVMRGLH
ncbi:TetR family transcriptional regulator [Antrihabitans stalactiti]|uniref:TetR/AcrR family transcriptional regulator n=1 Tax=Antrihabitans stalactiti TaxID=2584121 RepID=A0A848KV64_9NOCA|nr:TetR/AcrR family transcriptional regulator [Antrihabitans stalactiti]